MQLRKTVLALALGLGLCGLAHSADLLNTRFTGEQIFTPAFKALPGDPAKAYFAITFGEPKSEAGNLLLENGRITLGAVSGAAGKIEESSASSRPEGVIDLSKPYRITLRITEASSLVEGKDNFFIYVNNSSTKMTLSPHGEASVIARVPVKELKTGDNVFTASLGDARSFLQLRAESGARVKIESIKLESL
ncbi:MULTISPECIES: hypothetical protein [Uliginosibacterium]|uniref:Alginate biosynthesis protein AlgF n=1 Tax=Uliginosibacterium aquaticum TaxID=2731212 RepID=A0ABX2ICH6_9RHOO|nr:MULTISPECIES: hypothetical protein [Uliginosibacterium]MDO6386125.1 hypothetical protein [Uliginosibacterium sp. 31-12]NSL53692.1 hypothetical protein [Uliginosibacterium aquaticum]PLK49191.1 hypothetical protein C0V76_08300 [Uliginosibacterium sp. TH139]